MKKNLALFLCLLTVAFVRPFSDDARAFTFTDMPVDEGGNGFVGDDPCGYVMGTAAPYNSGYNTTVSFLWLGTILKGVLMRMVMRIRTLLGEILGPICI